MALPDVEPLRSGRSVRVKHGKGEFCLALLVITLLMLIVFGAGIWSMGPWRGGELRGVRFFGGLLALLAAGSLVGWLLCRGEIVIDANARVVRTRSGGLLGRSKIETRAFDELSHVSIRKAVVGPNVEAYWVGLAARDDWSLVLGYDGDGERAGECAVALAEILGVPVREGGSP